MNTINEIYKNLIKQVITEGDRLTTRNGKVRSLIHTPPIIFGEPPLVTVRNTAAMKAIREMEWFLSNDTICPNELLDWWDGQLNDYNEYKNGYNYQLRWNTFETGAFRYDGFDQIGWLIKQLKEHPNSRRLLTTTWNPGEMAYITETNNNPNTPATCHGTISQYFVRGGKLCMKTYQRSADLLLGVPHNWIQYWSYLVWLADMTGYEVGWLRWDFGDLHVYEEESHIKTAQAIIDANPIEQEARFIYRNPKKDWFDTKMFAIMNKPNPSVFLKPKLL